MPKGCSIDLRNSENDRRESMTNRLGRTALIFASLLGAVATLPFPAARADSSPQEPNNATFDDRCRDPMAWIDSTGIYDNFDSYRDATGRPCPGWGYLF
jgi:hypothetical protein